MARKLIQYINDHPKCLEGSKLLYQIKRHNRTNRKFSIDDVQKLLVGSKGPVFRKLIHTLFRAEINSTVYGNNNVAHKLNYARICKTYAMRARCLRLVGRLQAQ